MAKYCIITPTYSEHFKFIPKYLKSFDKNILDKENVIIFFIIEEQDKKNFYKIIEKWKHLNIEVLIFDTLLKKNNINISPKELLNKYDKFSYQTLKKLYAMLELNYDYFLILDSETMFIKPTKSQSLFEDYLQHPFIVFSSIDKRLKSHKFLIELVNNIDSLYKISLKKWFLESFSWFIDKRILLDLIQELGSPIEIVRTVYKNKDEILHNCHLFEGLLYYEYIYLHNDKYQYKLIDVDNLLIKYLSKQNYEQYLKQFYKTYNGHAGILEFALQFLNKNNVDEFIDLFNSYNFKILRCENSYYNYEYQSKFINMVKPNILAVSQEHAFGINNPFVTLAINGIYKIKFCKHFKRVIKPIGILLNYLGEIISVITYACIYIINYIIVIFVILKDRITRLIH